MDCDRWAGSREGEAGLTTDSFAQEPSVPVEYGDIKELAQKFGKKLGFEIPDTWRKGTHFYINDHNTFQVWGLPSPTTKTTVVLTRRLCRSARSLS